LTNYRLRFIENGKKENESEIYYSSSIPYGCIKTLQVPVGGNQSIDITTKDQRVFRFKFSSMQDLSQSYTKIIENSQVTKHSNLYAYDFMKSL